MFMKNSLCKKESVDATLTITIENSSHPTTKLFLMLETFFINTWEEFFVVVLALFTGYCTKTNSISS